MATNGHNSSCSWNVTDTMGKRLEMMFLIFLVTFLLVFLAVFGAWRRKSSWFLLKAMLWISYITSIALIPYILGLIQQAPSKDQLLIIWGMLLLIVYSFPDSFSAYSPEDIKQWRMNYVHFLSKFGALAILWVRRQSKETHLEFMVMCLFTLVVFLKFFKKSMALFSASRHSIEEKAKFSEIFMKFEHHLYHKSESDVVTMNGYHYIVATAGSKNLTLDNVLRVTPSNPSSLRDLIERKEVVTLQKVWMCKGRLLTTRGDPDNWLKDICLSYSLLRILYLKCANYAFPKVAKPKARKLILEGLLSKDQKNRVFRVIEVELKLLYELIYTKYPLFALPIFAMLRVLEFVLSLTVCGLSAIYIYKYADKGCGFNLDVVVTYVLLGISAFAECAQVWMIFSSEWVKAALIFHYVANQYCLNNIFAEYIIRKVCKPWYWKPWARVLGQYSLIESRGYGTYPWISAIASTICPERNWDWQCPRDAIQLSEYVKEAVLDSLRPNKHNLEKERCFPRHSNMYDELPGVTKCEHEAEVILVWHIATSYFQNKTSATSSCKTNCKVASDLSDYLAYLVAFVPRLLPGPHFEPEFHFRRVMEEAREAFQGCKNSVDKIRKLSELTTGDHEKIIVRGAMLGKKLLEKDEETTWKNLAEFWSDMALCAAISGEVKAHLEKLANGGEFITHLWALLHHVSYSPRTWLGSSDEADSEVPSTVAENQQSTMSTV